MSFSSLLNHGEGIHAGRSHGPPSIKQGDQAKNEGELYLLFSSLDDCDYTHARNNHYGVSNLASEDKNIYICVIQI